ncbi:MAG: DUF1738 domain-containing protein [Synergistaceae bacterium]|nr:DUF1738 domain-containing protein [Synergistaceae bacterium]MBQ6664305.1 DUF1738 domain-containing protein [Synergistaceae bacterium]MBQ6982680.1 DUF1738 domain-containing protein [Synergistaceae bacterium]
MINVNEYREYREDITNRIIEAVKMGTAPWQKSWSDGGTPYNAVTGKPYMGMNSIILSLVGEKLDGNEDPRWATRKQAESQGWAVRKGERHTKIFLLLLKDRKDSSGRLIISKNGKIAQDAIRKTFEVYHASQLIGIKPYVKPLHKPVISNETIEEIIYNSSARIFEGGNEACYYPGKDTICMPHKRSFSDTEGYYSTLLHEMAHWTGHRTRLDRFDEWNKDKKDYAMEELVAELASTFLSAETGLPQTQEHFENHASYIDSWVSILESNSNAIFTAASEAKKAADFILSFRDEEFLKSKKAS